MSFKKPSLSELRADSDVEFNFNVEQGYTPYTLSDYKQFKETNLQPVKATLGPSYDEEWERKRDQRQRQMQFAAKLNHENKIVIPLGPKHKQEKPKKDPSKREIMMRYASKIPKPKPQKPKSEPSPQVVAGFDLEGELRRHRHFQERVASMSARISKYM